MNAQSLPLVWTPSKEGSRVMYNPSVRVRVADRLRANAARLQGMTLTRKARYYSPLLSPQKVSVARNTGGALGDTAVLMLADPSNALRYAYHLLGVAREITTQQDKPLTLVLSEEVRVDVAEDVAQDDLRANETPETLRNYIERVDEAMAKLQEARDAAAKRLVELEDR